MINFVIYIYCMYNFYPEISLQLLSIVCTNNVKSISILIRKFCLSILLCYVAEPISQPILYFYDNIKNRLLLNNDKSFILIFWICEVSIIYACSTTINLQAQISRWILAFDFEFLDDNLKVDIFMICTYLMTAHIFKINFNGIMLCN